MSPREILGVRKKFARIVDPKLYGRIKASCFLRYRLLAQKRGADGGRRMAAALPAQRPPEASTGRAPSAALPRAAAAGGFLGPRTRRRLPCAAAARGGGDGGGGEDGGGEGVGGEQRRSGDMSPTAMYQIKYMRKPALKKDVAVLLAKYRERSRTLWNNKNRPSALVEGASSAEAAKKAAVEISKL